MTTANDMHRIDFLFTFSGNHACLAWFLRYCLHLNCRQFCQFWWQKRPHWRWIHLFPVSVLHSSTMHRFWRPVSTHS